MLPCEKSQVCIESLIPIDSKLTAINQINRKTTKLIINSAIMMMIHFITIEITLFRVFMKHTIEITYYENKRIIEMKVRCMIR